MRDSCFQSEEHMTLPHNIHLYYHKDANAEYGSFLDRQMDGTWPLCTECMNYIHPDAADFCPTHALADANDFLSQLIRDKAEERDLSDSAQWVKYWESVVLYGAASKETEQQSWDAMMMWRERVIKY
jgi:hypothetical protein